MSLKRLAAVLTMILVLLGMGCSSTPNLNAYVDVRKIEKGDIAPVDGTFLTAEATKQMAEIVKERNALREELMNYPDTWQRIWTDAAILVVGVGIGVWLIP